MEQHFISLMIFLPLIGAFVQALTPKLNRWVALFFSLLASLCALLLIISMKAQTPDLQAVVNIPWIGAYSISYELGIDGINVLMVLLVAAIFPVLLASEWDQKVGIRGLFGLLLVLQSSFFGAVCAQDLFLLFFFWALSSLPFYFLIGIWGGKNRETAAFRSMVSFSIGNALFFAALILIYYTLDAHSFSIRELSGGKLAGKTISIFGADVGIPILAFSLISLGLALRAPVWPLHGWLTQAAEEAPASVFVALGGVGVPVATYIFLRLIYSLFPETVTGLADVIVTIGAINMILGGVCAASQKTLKGMLAYLCLSEVGFILVGVGSLNSSGLVGAIYQQFAMGLGLAAFGLFSGLIYSRTSTADFISESGESSLGGIAMRAPALAIVAGVAIAALLGIPGTIGFVGHSLLMIGGFSVHPVVVLIGSFTVLLATYYLFNMYRVVFLGTASAKTESFSNLTLREKACLFPMVIALLFLGIYPKPLIELVRPSAVTLLSTLSH